MYLYVISFKSTLCHNEWQLLQFYCSSFPLVWIWRPIHWVFWQHMGQQFNLSSTTNTLYYESAPDLILKYCNIVGQYQNRRRTNRYCVFCYPMHSSSFIKKKKKTTSGDLTDLFICFAPADAQVSSFRQEIRFHATSPAATKGFTQLCTWSYGCNWALLPSPFNPFIIVLIVRHV